MSRNSTYLILGTLLLTLLSGSLQPALAANGMQPSQDVKPIYSVVTDYWPPFRIDGGHGAIAGIDRDIMDEIGRRMGIEFRWKKRPWVRCLYEIEHGEADLITGIAMTPERARYTLYSPKPYFILSPAFYVHTDTGADAISRYEDLEGMTIGFVRGSAYFPRFDSDETLDKEAGATEEQLLTMLREKRWDTIIGTDAQVDYDLARLGLESTIIKAHFKPKNPIELFMGISKRSGFVSRYKEFVDTLEELVRDGTVKNIANRYFTSK